MLFSFIWFQNIWLIYVIRVESLVLKFLLMVLVIKIVIICSSDER